MQTAHKKTALVTGGSSGIGRCTAAALRDAGCTVYEFSRRDIPMEGVHHMSVDVTDEAAVRAAVELGDIHTGFSRPDRRLLWVMKNRRPHLPQRQPDGKR